MDESYANNQLSRMLPRNSELGEWTVSTGAPNHMLPIVYVLPSSSLDQGLVYLSRGEHLVASHIGPRSIAPHFILDNILHIPHLTYRLLSLSHLTCELDCMATFGPDVCVIYTQDRTSRGLIGLGEVREGVYFLWHIAPSSFLSSVPSNPSSTADMVSVSTSSSHTSSLSITGWLQRARNVPAYLSDYICD